MKKRLTISALISIVGAGLLTAVSNANASSEQESLLAREWSCSTLIPGYIQMIDRSNYDLESKTVSSQVILRSLAYDPVIDVNMAFTSDWEIVGGFLKQTITEMKTESWEIVGNNNQGLPANPEEQVGLIDASYKSAIGAPMLFEIKHLDQKSFITQEPNTAANVICE